MPSFALSPSLRFLHVALAACLLLGACANTAGMSPAQQAIEQSKRRFVATTAEGALVGALLGAAIGAAAGGGRGAAIGAGAGAVAGGVAGAMVAQNNFRRTHSEADLNAAINDSTQEATQARQDAATATIIANEARAKSSALRAQLKAGQITSAQYQAGISQYRQSLVTIQTMSKALDEKAASIRSNASSAGGRGASLLASANDISNSSASMRQTSDTAYNMLAAEPL